MNRIKGLREERNWTQSQLGEKIQVQAAAISKYETEKIPLTDDTIKKLAEIFDCSTDYLLGKTDIPTPSGQNEDDEVWELRREMAERDEMRTLFSLAKKAKKEDVQFANELLKKLRGNDD